MVNNLLSQIPLIRSGFDAFRQRSTPWNATRIASSAQQQQTLLSTLTDSQLQQRVVEFATNHNTLPQIAQPSVLVIGLSLVSEGARRILGMPYRLPQFMAAAELFHGKMVEMATGEGKSLSATAPAILRALSGQRVHIATTNEYLAERDAEAFQSLYKLFGLTSSCIKSQQQPPEKRRAYRANIVYGTGYEFGFDYLRDRLALTRAQQHGIGTSIRSKLSNHRVDTPCLQGSLDYTIVDELDSVLIDEARLPLILAVEQPTNAQAVAASKEANRIALQLQYNLDWIFVSPKQVALTDHGLETSFKLRELERDSGLSRPWYQYVENALMSQHVFQNEVHYVVAKGKVQIVDENTGRILPERTWSDGLHQAVEAKEVVEITAEKKSDARITRQRFYKLYGTLCGMSGTLTECSAELTQAYQLGLHSIPLHRPCQRITLPSRFYCSAEQKYEHIAVEAKQISATGRPVLIGTRTIRVSRLIAAELERQQLSFTILNGLQDRAEAEIIEHAGAERTVTIATNMAGRGTDIRLSPGIAEIGGLHVIGSEAHESFRIDRQLAGRAGRQGDPGSSRFHISADDPLLQMHMPQLSHHLREQCRTQPVESEHLTSLIRNLQHTLEQQAWQNRLKMASSDDRDDQLLRTVARS